MVMSVGRCCLGRMDPARGGCEAVFISQSEASAGEQRRIRGGYEVVIIALSIRQ